MIAALAVVPISAFKPVEVARSKNPRSWASGSRGNSIVASGLDLKTPEVGNVKQHTPELTSTFFSSCSRPSPLETLLCRNHRSRLSSGTGLFVSCKDRRCWRSCRCNHHDVDDDDERTCEARRDCSFLRGKVPKEGSSCFAEVADASNTDQCSDQSGYVIRVSKELMGVFRYVEKVKRAKIKELADTLRQVAGACLLFSCVRGIVNPLVEVFKTQPPCWGNLILMLGSFDSFAITYLALKASEPLLQLSVLATECQSDMMGSIKKEEEHLLALAVELVKLFRRLRNVTIFTAVIQFVQLVHALLQLRDPTFTCHIANFFSSWFDCPWS